MEVAAGEYGYDTVYFRRMLEAGAVDVLQADVTRCGGITGFMGAGFLAEAAGYTLVALRALLHLHRLLHNSFRHANIFTITSHRKHVLRWHR